MSDSMLRTLNRGTLKTYFDMFDKDASGYVTTAEMRHAMTCMGVGLTDDQMNRLMNRYDENGDGTLALSEFEEMVRDLGFKIVDYDDEDVVNVPAIPPPKLEPVAELAHGDEHPGSSADFVAITDPELAKILEPLQNAEGKVRLSHVRQAVECWQKLHNVTPPDAESDLALHWQKGRLKRGLGEVIHKANHIALIVSDVGRSAKFYSDVLGLQQIRRPDFDRHGAWFTMGNMELHLIKGVPVVHSGKDLIVGHISIETYDIDKVPEILKRLHVPFRQNVSVPKGKMAQGSGTNSSNTSSEIVKQYFLRDPDGYYIEICNCDVLTKYCLGSRAGLAGYDEGAALDVETATTFLSLGFHLAHRALAMQAEFDDIAAAFKGQDAKIIARRLGCKKPAIEVDEGKLHRLLTRKSVYGDIIQNESEESIKEILMLANNKLPMALRIMEIRGHEENIFQPPAFYEEGETKIVPETIHIAKKPRTGDVPDVVATWDV